MNRSYELMFIIRPDIPDEDADRVVSTIENAATGAGSIIRKIDRMGKRRLAYRVGGFRDGNYVLFELDTEPQTIAELERRLRVTEPVLKFLTVRTDEMEKRLAKAKKHREARIRRRPAPAPASPEAAAEMPPASAPVPEETGAAPVA